MCQAESRGLGLIPVAQLVKNLPANTGDARAVGSFPGLGRAPRERNGNPLQYSCLKNQSLAGCSPRARREPGVTAHASPQ